jgi:hypothetical protein
MLQYLKVILDTRISCICIYKWSPVYKSNLFLLKIVNQVKNCPTLLYSTVYCKFYWKSYTVYDPTGFRIYIKTYYTVYVCGLFSLPPHDPSSRLGIFLLYNRPSPASHHHNKKLDSDMLDFLHHFPIILFALYVYF